MNFRILSLLALASLPAHAGDSGQQNETAELDEVVVTATRGEARIEDLPMPVTVIGRDVIERNAGVTLPDLLRQVAGIDVAQSGGPGQLATLFIRGTESDHVLVLIDGVEINPGTLETPSIQNIDPEIIERIEIVKGPRSSLYGSEAIGGVINIITRSGTGSRFSAMAGAGSFGTQQAAVALSHGSKQTSTRIDISRKRANGFPPRIGSDIDRGYENTTVNARVDHKLDDFSVGISHFQTQGTTEYLGGGVFGSPFVAQSQEFENRVTEARGRYRGDDWQSLLSISMARDELQQNDSAEFANTDRLTIDWQNDLALSDADTFTLGLYHAREDVEADGFGLINESTDISALYAQSHFAWDGGELYTAARFSDHEIFGSQTSWNIDAGFDVSEPLHLRANLGKAFRSPNATFLYNPFYGNPDLQPEISLNREIGLDWQITDRHQLGLSLFRNDIDELIGSDPVTFALVNIDEARIEGAELAYRWRGVDWQFDAQASWQDPRNALDDSQLLRRARRSLTANLTRRWQQLDIGLALIASGPRQDIDAATFAPAENAGYVIGNLSADWRFASDWSLQGRIENLGDAEYQSVSGYRPAERSLFLTLRYSR